MLRRRWLSLSGESHLLPHASEEENNFSRMQGEPSLRKGLKQQFLTLAVIRMTWELLKILLPRQHPRQVKSEFLGVDIRHLFL